MVPAFVEIAQLGKTYATPDGPAEIVRDFTLDVGEGEFVCISGTRAAASPPCCRS